MAAADSGKRIGNVDPGADLASVREAGNKGEREGGAAGAFGSGEFADGTDGETAAECVIKRGDASGRGGADDAGRGGERGGDAAGKGGFDLEAEQVGGRHG